MFLVQAGARKVARNGLRSGDIRMARIAAADHTFSQQGPRLELARQLSEMMAHRFTAPAAPERAHETLS